MAHNLVWIGVGLCSLGAFLLFEAGADRSTVQGFQNPPSLSSQSSVAPSSITGSTFHKDGSLAPTTSTTNVPSHRRGNSVLGMLSGMFKKTDGEGSQYPVLGEERIMAPKGHGSTEKPVQENLRWGSDRATADNICSFNRHYAEYAGYWKGTGFLEEAKNAQGEITFYDSVTGKPLFVAPRGRTMEQFLEESADHGWPSFRDEEVVWENVRVLGGRRGEAVSVDGTHLGHNLPDWKGNRYCINLVSVAGNPEK